MAGEQVQLGIGANNDQLNRTLDESQSSLHRFFESITEGVGGIGSSLDGMQEKFASAFEFVGASAAIEAIEKIGSTIQHLGEEATQIRTVSDVLGVTVEQYQAMQQAAAEAGTSQETLTRAAEKLATTLTSARQGSAEAVKTLRDLGVSLEQIQDPAFGVNDILRLMHDRLNDAATAQSTMSELMKEFGPRAALAAEALKNYDGSAEGVARVMEEINGLSDETTKSLQAQKKSVDDLEKSTSNWFATLMAGSQGRAINLKGLNAFTLSNAGSASAAEAAVNPPKSAVPDAAAQAAQAAQQVADSAARESEDLSRQMLEAEIQADKSAVNEFKSGTAERLAALQILAADTAQLYGSGNEAARAADNQVLAATREFNETQEREYRTAMQQHQQLVLESARAEIASANQVLDNDVRAINEEERFEEQLANFSTQLVQRTTRMQIQSRQQLVEDNARIVETYRQQWSGVSNAISSSVGNSIVGLLGKTQSFGDAAKNIFGSLVEALIQMFVDIAVRWAETMLINMVVSKTTAASQVADNAAVAGSAAVASAASIPVYGWLIAAAAGAAVFAAAAAFSAQDGFDVPSGLNPVTQLHAREMVLPADLADRVRNMTGGGGSGGGSAGGAVHLKGQSVGDHVIVTKANLAQTLRELGYEFKIPGGFGGR